MWISQKLREDSSEKIISTGTAVSGGNNLIISGRTERRSPICAVPYGFYGKIPQGTEVVMCEDAVVGTAKKSPVDIEEGEVCMYSKGGYIVIKNNGDIIINGRKAEL